MLLHFFATPVLSKTAKDFKLVGIQNEITKACEKITFSKNENWVSNNHSLSDISFQSNFIEEYDLKLLKKFISSSVDEYLQGTIGQKMPYKIIQSWMTKTVKGEITTLHNHGMFDIAGVYYYKSNSEDGNIKFINPNAGLAASQTFIKEYDVHVEPKEGLLILFPAWLNHMVEMNNTDSERMSLSFNINIDRSKLYDNNETEAG